jgi:hypothetical protein
VHRKNILIYIQQDATLHSLFYLETALHVSGGTPSHHQERKQLYLQHLVFVRPLLKPAAIAEGSNNGVTNTRCCRYSCLCTWWWVGYHPKHVEQFPDKTNCVTLHLVGYILEYNIKITYRLLSYSHKKASHSPFTHARTHTHTHTHKTMRSWMNLSFLQCLLVPRLPNMNTLTHEPNVL